MSTAEDGGASLATQLTTTMDLSSTSTPRWSKFLKRVIIREIILNPDGGATFAEQKVSVGGWVKTGRVQGKGDFSFLELNDGSCPNNMQVIVESSVVSLAKLVATETSVFLEGELQNQLEGTNQKKELRAKRVLEVGTVDSAKYPIPKTRLTLETLRDLVHLRPRTNTVLHFLFNGMMDLMVNGGNEMRDNCSYNLPHHHPSMFHHQPPALRAMFPPMMSMPMQTPMQPPPQQQLLVPMGPTMPMVGYQHQLWHQMGDGFYNFGYSHNFDFRGDMGNGSNNGY